MSLEPALGPEPQLPTASSALSIAQPCVGWLRTGSDVYELEAPGAGFLNNWQHQIALSGVSPESRRYRLRQLKQSSENQTMLTLLILAIGAFLGFAAAKSGTFREGGGLVLLFICVGAIVVAAVGGAASALLPAFLAVWTGRIALFCVAFAVSAFLSDR